MFCKFAEAADSESVINLFLVQNGPKCDPVVVAHSSVDRIKYKFASDVLYCVSVFLC